MFKLIGSIFLCSSLALATPADTWKNQDEVSQYYFILGAHGGICTRDAFYKKSSVICDKMGENIIPIKDLVTRLYRDPKNANIKTMSIIYYAYLVISGAIQDSEPILQALRVNSDNDHESYMAVDQYLDRQEGYLLKDLVPEWNYLKMQGQTDEEIIKLAKKRHEQIKTYEKSVLTVAP